METDLIIPPKEGLGTASAYHPRSHSIKAGRFFDVCGCSS